MLQKEKDYDAYLADQIKEGLNDLNTGRIHSLEECQMEWQEIIEQLEEENKNFEREIAYV